MPSYTGQELWEVHYNSFNDVAIQEGWCEADKLRELLPILQGKACEFVYGQLSSTTRRKFTALVDEIQYRFRKVESSHTYSLKFSNRTQKTGETAEDFAGEPKKYYDKAYPK